MVAWTVGEYLDNLKTNLLARLAAAGGFDDVKVFTAPISLATLPKEAVAFIDAEAIEEPAALGGARNQETVTLTGMIRIVTVGQGDADVIAKAARDRALAILEQLEKEIRITPGQGVASHQVNRAHVKRKTLAQTVEKDGPGRVALVEFDVEYGARTDIN